MVVRVFPRQTTYTPTDDLAFVGDPPLFRPAASEVHVSVTFTWDIAEGERLARAWGDYYPAVKLGGPALGSDCSLFQAGVFVKPGVTFTTRGCNRRCAWCLVPTREGRFREITNFADGHIIQDNNLLQASKAHLSRVFAMLKRQTQAAVFAGGLDARLVDDWIAEQLQNLRIDQLFLAADTQTSLVPLKRALDKLAFLPRRKLRVYTLIGRESQEEAVERLGAVWALGGLPFAQLYQPPDRYIKYSPDWKALVRTWSRPAAMFAQHKGGGPMPDNRSVGEKEVR